MTPDFKVRPTAMQLLNHPWTLKHATPADASRIAALPGMLPKVGMSVSVSQPTAAAAAAKAAAMSAGGAPAANPAPAAAAVTAQVVSVTADSRAAGPAAAAVAEEPVAVAATKAPMPAAVTTAPKIQVIADKAGQAPLGSPISAAAGGSILAYVPAATITDGSNASLSTVNMTGSTMSGVSTLSSTCTTSSYSIQSSAMQSVGSKSGSLAMDKSFPASTSTGSTGSSVSVADSAASMQAAGGLAKHPSGSRSPITPLQEPITEATEESGGSLGATYPAPRRRSSSGKGKKKSSKKLLKWMCIAGKGGVRSAQSVSQ